MAKIEFSKVTNANTLSVINDNFDKLALELQEKVYYRVNPYGEPNALGTPMDFNGNPAYNVGVITEIPESELPKDQNIVFVTKYGLPVTQNTVNAAVADLRANGGGILYFPNNTAKDIAIPDLGDEVTLEMGGFDLPVTHFGETRGSAGVAQKVFRGQNNRTNDKIHSVVHVESFPKGSGQSGQVTADVGLSVGVVKQGLGGTSARQGELNGVDISVRNDGVNSDTAALLLNVASYGTGFHALIEGVVTDIKNNQIVKGLNTQLCVIDNQTGKTYGLVIQSQTGGQDVGLLIQNTSGGAFNDFAIYKKDGIIVHQVDGFGGITLIDGNTNANRSKIKISNVGGTLNFQGENSSLMSLTQGGRLQVANELSIGPYALINNIGGSASAGGIAKPSGYAGYIGMQYNGATYRIPYYNE